jgi:hypothetical protein
MEIRFARRFSAYSSTIVNGKVVDVRAIKRIGDSAGFTFLKFGGEGMSWGR